MRKLTDTEVVDMLKSERPWNIARRLFSTNTANICRYENLSPLELRRMEFEAVAEIAAALGVMLPGSGDPVGSDTPREPPGLSPWEREAASGTAPGEPGGTGGRDPAGSAS